MGKKRDSGDKGWERNVGNRKGWQRDNEYIFGMWYVHTGCENVVVVVVVVVVKVDPSPLSFLSTTSGQGSSGM